MLPFCFVSNSAVFIRGCQKFSGVGRRAEPVSVNNGQALPNVIHIFFGGSSWLWEYISYKRWPFKSVSKTMTSCSSELELQQQPHYYLTKEVYHRVDHITATTAILLYPKVFPPSWQLYLKRCVIKTGNIVCHLYPSCLVWHLDVLANREMKITQCDVDDVAPQLTTDYFQVRTNSVTWA